MNRIVKLVCFVGIAIYICSISTFTFANCGNCCVDAKTGKCPMKKDSNFICDKSGKCSVYACPTEKCPYHSGKPGECKHCKKGLVKSDLTFKCPKCGMKFDKPGKCTMDGEKLVPEIIKSKTK